MAPRIERTDLAEALARWLAPVLPLPEEAVPAPLAAGRVLAREVLSWRSLPPYALSAVDGYAVRAGELARDGELRLGEAAVWAGQEPGALQPGEAAFVATGAALPAVADAVVPIELAEVTGEGGERRLRASRPVATGANVRSAGEDLAAGAAAVRLGERVEPLLLPLLLAAAGGREVLVVRRPRVHLLPTGDELVPPGHAPDATRVMEVVGSAVAADARAQGAEVTLAAPLPDDLGRLATALAAAARQADLVVTVGGASVGRHDYAVRALLDAGGDVRFHGLRLRPGTPAFGGHVGAAAVLGLPGNPAAALTVWELVGREALSRLLGTQAPAPVEAILDEPSDKRAVREDRYLRASVWVAEGVLRARVWQGQNAGMLVPLARTNALVCHPGGAGRLERGARVEARLTGALAARPPAWPQ